MRRLALLLALTACVSGSPADVEPCPDQVQYWSLNDTAVVLDSIDNDPDCEEAP